MAHYRFLSLSISLFIFIIFSISCSVKINLESNKNSHKLRGANFYINDFEHIPWKVGSNKETQITKGFMITIHYPKFTNQILKELTAIGADSWAIEVIRIPPRGGQEVLGYIKAPYFHTIPEIYIPLISKSHNKIFIKVIYAAAAPSKRFEEFECPAFGHNRKINDIYYDPLSPIPSLSIFPQSKLNVPFKEIETGGFQAIEFNGGTSLEGKYYFRFALFNSRERNYYSDFQESDNILIIENEEKVTIPGCSGNSPIPSRSEDESKNFKKFKFGS